MNLVGLLPRRLASVRRPSRVAAALVFAALATLALSACGGGGGGGGVKTTFPPPKTPPPPTAQELSFAQQVFDLVNNERTSRGIAPLLPDPDAADTAFDHSFDMADRGFFDHTNPEGEDPGDRLTRHGVSWAAWGENIAQGQPTPAAVMTAWMNSQGHRENILNPIFGHLGVGCYLASGGPWWTQDFTD